MKSLPPKESYAAKVMSIDKDGDGQVSVGKFPRVLGIYYILISMKVRSRFAQSNFFLQSGVQARRTGEEFEVEHRFTGGG